VGITGKKTPMNPITSEPSAVIRHSSICIERSMR
jgi:hypothetical protein